MSLADRITDGPDSRRGGKQRVVSNSKRASPYPRPAPSLPGGADDGNWQHDKFAEVNNISSNALASRITSGSAPASTLYSKALGGIRNTSSLSSRLTSAPPSNSSSSGPGLSIRGAGAPTSTTVEIKELLSGTTAEDVKTVFSGCGSISDVVLVKDNGETVVMRVTYADRKEMLKAVQDFDGQQADGRTLSVKEYIPPASAPPSRSVDILAGDSRPEGKMYSDAIDGGLKVQRPSRTLSSTSDSWRGRNPGTRGFKSGGRRGGGRGRGGASKEGGDDVQMGD